MKTILLTALLLIVQYSGFGQNGFTNKAEAKNQTVNGLKQGKWVEYLKIDNKHSIVTTTPDSAKFYRLVIYKDGNFTETERLYDTSNKLVDSAFYAEGYALNKKFHENGNLQSEIPYTNGKINGLLKTYNKDEVVIMEAPYRDGILNGIYKIHTGTSYIETPYADGKPHGIMKTYSNEKLISEVAFTEGIVSNTSKIYSYGPNGALLMEIFICPGKGWTKHYDEDGTLQLFKDDSKGVTYNYKNGQLVSSYNKDYKTTYYNENNQPKAQNSFWDGLVMATEILAGINAANLENSQPTQITEQYNKNIAAINQMQAAQNATTNQTNSNSQTYNTAPNVNLSQQQPTTANSKIYPYTTPTSDNGNNGYNQSAPGYVPVTNSSGSGSNSFTSNSSGNSSGNNSYSGTSGSSTSASSGTTNSGSANTSSNSSSTGQKYAKPCGSGCYQVKANIRYTNDGFTYYGAENNSAGALDIHLYIEHTDGNWERLGGWDNLASGQTGSDSGMWTTSDRATGKYVFFYRDAGSKDIFPTGAEVKAKSH